MIFITKSQKNIDKIDLILNSSSSNELFHHGEFSYCFSEKYIVHYINDKVILYSGFAMFDGKEFEPFSYKDIDALNKDLMYVVGYFSLIVIEENRLILTSSLYKYIDIFYSNMNDNLLISTSVDLLLKLIGGSPVNENFVFDFSTDNLKYGSETFFKNISHVPLGEAVFFDSKKGVSSKTLNIPITSEPISFTDELKKSIEFFTASKQNVCVQFSGGLDSSLILHITKKVYPNCTALHILTGEDDLSSELHIAKEVAKEFSAKLLVKKSPVKFSIPHTSFNMKNKVNTPFDISPFSPDPGNMEFFYHDQMRGIGMEQYCFLSGHGGDYVFLQNPSINIGYDGYKNGGVIGFFNAIKSYSQLKKVPFISLLHSNVFSAFNIEKPNVQFPMIRLRPSEDNCIFSNHSLLKGVSTKSAKFYHLKSILSGLYELKPSNYTSCQFLHPIFLQNILSGVIAEPVSKMFSGDYDRLQIRKEFYNSSSSSIAWRRTKRSSSNSVFTFFHNNEELIKEYLTGGVIASILDIDPEWIQEEVAENSNITTTYHAGLLLNLLKLEIYAKSFLQHIHF